MLSVQTREDPLLVQINISIYLNIVGAGIVFAKLGSRLLDSLQFEYGDQYKKRLIF